MRTRNLLLAATLLTFGLSVQAQNSDATNQPQPKHHGKSAAGEYGSGAGDAGKGAAGGVGNAAAGVGKGAGAVAPLHPVKGAAAVGKGGVKGGADVGKGAAKGTGKVVKGTGKVLTHPF